MSQTYKNTLKKFFENRVDEIEERLIGKNMKYQKLTKTSIKVYYQIRDSLPDQYKKF